MTFFINIQRCTLYPITVDLWIIPQAVKSMKDFATNWWLGVETDTINQMGGGDGRESKIKDPIWILDDALNAAGYRKGTDYWCQTVECPSNVSHIAVQQQMLKMMQIANPQNKSHQRFLFILDRRQPICLQKRKMDLVDSSDATNQTMRSDDRLYLVKPKWRSDPKHPQRRQYHTVTPYFRTIPEACFSLPQQLLFPRRGDADYGVNDMMNGYKFVVSYHVLQHDQVRAYWYIHGGGQRFQIEDAAWIWPRYFSKVKGKEQRLSSDQDLKSYAESRPLLDDDFYEFQKQCNAMRIKKPAETTDAEQSDAKRKQQRIRQKVDAPKPAPEVVREHKNQRKRTNPHHEVNAKVPRNVLNEPIAPKRVKEKVPCFVM